MPFRLLVTADLTGRTSHTEQVIGENTSVAGEVVLASQRHLSGWHDGDFSGGLWIVLGDGPVPAGLRPFLRLAADAGREELDSAVDAAAEVLHLRQQTETLEGEVARARERQLDLARVGIALSAERDIDQLLQLILTTARELVVADAGSLYLIEELDGQRLLRFVLAQNDSVPASLAGATVPLDSSSLAGHVAATGEPLSVEDVRYIAGHLPYRSNPSFDVVTGYHTRSLLTAPMATRAGEVVGVLQLINRKRDRGARIATRFDADASVLPFGEEEIEVIRSLAAGAAVAIENTRLVQEIERLFEAFVRASVATIEQRDPSTSGHSLRVAHYTVSLARAVEEDPPARYADVRFSRDSMTQLRYAALLHDFGKVAVREAVLTKGKKLFPDRLARIQERFRHAARTREVELLRRLLANLERMERPPAEEDLEAVNRAVREVRKELDEQLAAVLVANEPTVLQSATSHLLRQAAHAAYRGEDGQNLSLLFPEELRALAVPLGSLDEEERLEVESHVVHSYQFLLTIPWPRRYARVPEIAYGHHEKLNGRGYPNRLLAEQIPLEVRMMTVCDIYDALAAGDRPYKRAVTPERALEILREEAGRGAIDPDLLRLFIDAKVYARPLPEVAG